MFYNRFQYKRQKARVSPGLLVMGLSVALCMLFLITPVQAQSSREITNRLNRLENELETLNRAVYKGERATQVPSTYDRNAGSNTGAGGRAQAANLEVRLQQLERELRDTRGLIEQQNHAVRQIKTQLEKTVSDMDLRLSDLERSASPHKMSNAAETGVSMNGLYPEDSSAATAATSYQTGKLVKIPAGKIPSGSLTTSNDPAASLYEDAFSLLKNEQYESAGLQFQNFLGTHPNHVLAGNAKYWLGESYYVRGNFERAARIFAEGFQKYPNSAKAPDNLLKLSLSLRAMGNTDDACTALRELNKKYGNTSSPVMRRAKQEIDRLGCS